MVTERSFTSYIKSKFYNELFAAVQGFVSENIDILTLRLQVVEDIDEVNVEDFEIKQVYIDDQPEMRINFEILVEAYLEVWDAYRKKVDEPEAAQQWFQIGCSGDLSKNFTDFEIEAVDTYNNKPRPKNRMTENLVPVFGKDNMESVAKSFLYRHYSHALSKPIKLDPYLLADNMGLTILEKQIFNDMSVFGQIYFHDADGEFFDLFTGESEIETVKAGTIIVDPNVQFLRGVGSRNNTIVHECLHWDKHRKAFELERLFNNDVSKISCQTFGGIRGNGKESTSWMEYQANSLAPKILMPFDMFKQEAKMTIRDLMDKMSTQDILDVIEPAIDGLAEYFGVSKLSAKIRMVEVGFDVAIGAYNYLGGKYIPAHYWSKDAIEANETFSIGALDAAIQIVANPRLTDDMRNGAYIYVESYFCLNDDKYIETDLMGERRLTAYARHNMDECCLVFDISVATHGIAGAYKLECVLNRNDRSGLKGTSKNV